MEGVLVRVFNALNESDVVVLDTRKPRHSSLDCPHLNHRRICSGLPLQSVSPSQTQCSGTQMLSSQGKPSNGRPSSPWHTTTFLGLFSVLQSLFLINGLKCCLGNKLLLWLLSYGRRKLPGNKTGTEASGTALMKNTSCLSEQVVKYHYCYDYYYY